VQPERKEEVTIFFSDIVGYTHISSVLQPTEVSDMLHRLYQKFDALALKHKVAALLGLVCLQAASQFPSLPLAQLTLTPKPTHASPRSAMPPLARGRDRAWAGRA
jgi:class 3 adenylate cyclase